MRLMGERLVDDEVFEGYALMGVRAILKDRRARSILNELKDDDPSAYSLVMSEAWRRYASLPLEFRRNRNKGISELIEEGDRLQVRMIEKAKEEGIFDQPG